MMEGGVQVNAAGPALSRRDRRATPRPRCRCWRSPAASPGIVFDDRAAGAWRAASRTFATPRAAGALRPAADADALARVIGCDPRRCGHAGGHRAWPGRRARSPLHARAAALACRQGHRRAVPHPGRAGHRRAVPRAAATMARPAKPAGGRRRGARRLGQCGLGLSVGQRPAQRRGRWLHRRADARGPSGRETRA